MARAPRHTRVGGEVQLFNIRISGTAEFDGCTIDGALTLGRAVIDGSLHLRRGCTVNGKLRLKGAQVHGALLARGLVVNGTLNAISTRIGDALSLVDVTVHHPQDWALILIEVQAPRLTLRLTPASRGGVSLRDAHVGRLIDDVAGWPSGCQVDAGGLTYDRLSGRMGDGPRPTAQQRLDWLHTYAVLNGSLEPAPGQHFTPGAYEQLAAALRWEGREQEARMALQAKERLRHRSWGVWGACWGRVQDIVVGFGYRPGRALLWMALLLVLGTVYFHLAGPLAAVNPDGAPTWDPFLYSLDVLLPLLGLGHDTAWDPTGWTKAATVTLMVSGWVLVTMVIAGLGRALKRQ